jgi:hypothetical protein
LTRFVADPRIGIIVAVHARAEVEITALRGSMRNSFAALNSFVIYSSNGRPTSGFGASAERAYLNGVCQSANGHQKHRGYSISPIGDVRSWRIRTIHRMTDS